MNKARITLYCVGGAGLNLGTKFHAGAGSTFSDLRVAYLDTSEANANVLTAVPAANVYRFPNLRGGGKNRQELHQKIVPHIPDVLKLFPPSDFNIVLHSSAGASGSTVGPELVREILRRNSNVLVVQAGSTSDRTVTRNTLATLKTYALISSQVKRPVVSYYQESGVDHPPSSVDVRILSALYLSCLLFSNKNTRVDNTDLANLFNYHKVTSFEPELSGIEFFQDNIEKLPEHIVPQSMAVLVPQDKTDLLGVPIPNIRTEYICDGVLAPEFSKELGEKSLYALIYTGDFRRNAQKLQDDLAAYDEQAEEHRRQQTSLSAGGLNESDEMVF